MSTHWRMTESESEEFDSFGYPRFYVDKSSVAASTPTRKTRGVRKVKNDPPTWPSGSELTPAVGHYTSGDEWIASLAPLEEKEEKRTMAKATSTPVEHVAVTSLATCSVASRPTIKCDECLMIGHTASKCWYKFPQFASAKFRELQLLRKHLTDEARRALEASQAEEYRKLQARGYADGIRHHIQGTYWCSST